MQRPNVKDYDLQIYSFAEQLSLYVDYLEDENKKLQDQIKNNNINLRICPDCEGRKYIPETQQTIG